MPSSSQRILVRGVNWLGDAVMTTPALLRLREAKPGAHITLLTRTGLKDIWNGHPAINEVMTFEVGEGALSVGKKLRAGAFDLGLALPNSPRAALELWLAGIPERVAYARPWRNALLTCAVPPRAGAVEMQKRSKPEVERLIAQSAGAEPEQYPAQAHQIYDYLHLVSVLGAKPEAVAPRLEVSDAAVSEFATRFGLIDGAEDSECFLGMNPGAEYGPAKRWPEERFIEAAVQIYRHRKCRWLVFGLQKEKESAERIAQNICGATGKVAAINLAGATSLAEFCAGQKFCRVLLANDSGPMHVAAAVGTPVVALFGSTLPELTGPGLPGDKRHSVLCARVPCSPCYLRECPIDFRCMTGISVYEVVKAVVGRLKEQRR